MQYIVLYFNVSHWFLATKNYATIVKVVNFSGSFVQV